MSSPPEIVPIVMRPLFAYWDESAILNILRYVGSFVGLATNLLLLWIIFSSKLRLHQYNWYMALLALADIAIAAGQILRATFALFAASYGTVLFSRWTCVLINTPMSMGFAMTKVVVLALAADRLYMVLHPITYHSKFNKYLFSVVLSVGLLFVSLDTFSKLYRVDHHKPIVLCSMGSSQGPLAPFIGQFFSYTCLSLLFFLYIPFLVIYWKKSSIQNGIASSWQWRRQFEVTGTTIWLLFLYAFLWGGAYTGLLLANLSADPPLYSGCVTYLFGFASSMCSSASFFVYFLKHPEMRKQAKLILMLAQNKQQQKQQQQQYSTMQLQQAKIASAVAAYNNGSTA